MSANTRLSLVTFAAGIAALVIAAGSMFASEPPSRALPSPSPFCAGPTWHPMPEVAHGGHNVDPG